MYAIWVRIDETLPWIELKGKYATRRDAINSAREILSHTVVKIVEMPKKK